jgi:hypothetical protein
MKADDKARKAYEKAIRMPDSRQKRNMIKSIRENWATEKKAELKAKGAKNIRIFRDDNGEVTGMRWCD